MRLLQKSAEGRDDENDQAWRRDNLHSHTAFGLQYS